MILFIKKENTTDSVFSTDNYSKKHYEIFQNVKCFLRKK